VSVEEGRDIPIYFNVHGSVHRNNILIYIQQDATFQIKQTV